MSFRQLNDVDSIADEIKDFFVIAIFLLIILVILGLKSYWWPPVYRATFGKLKLPNIRDYPGVGWFIAHILCPCVYDEYHPNFTLILKIQHATKLRYTEGILGKATGKAMDVYCIIQCGNNPVKTTCIADYLPSGQKPAIWDEKITLNVTTSTEYLKILLADYDKVGDDDEIGQAKLVFRDSFTDENWKELNSSGSVRLEETTLKVYHEGKLAGQIVVSGKCVLSGKSVDEIRQESPLLE